MRDVLRGGVIGGLPGFLITLVPLVLHNLGLISADQSQIGFAGVPLLFIGVVVGTLLGASNSDHTGKVMLGVALGFVAGLIGGVLIDAALRSIGATVPGIWLFLAPVAMIAGGVLGAWWGERNPSSRKPAPRH